MKLPIIGGAVFLLGGAAALAAVALSSRGTATPTANGPAEAAVVKPGTPASEGSLVFSVPDMHCEFACAPAVREALAAVPGVEKVETDVENQTATVFVGDGFDEEKALAALTGAGYPGKTAAK